MAFNFKLLFRLTYKALFASHGTHARLTPKRLCILLIVTVFYVALEIANWIGFLLDRILFPGYRRQEIRQPVFIIGVPRSGTTFLHRLLAQDETQFTSMKFWEILFAPSVTQKKFLKALGEFDRLCGSPLFRVLSAAEKRFFKSFSDLHQHSLFEAEEDGHILLHIFSSAIIFSVLPFEEELLPYFLFDMELDAARRARIMAFYKRCVQNHLYVFGRNKRFLSKNPVFSTMVQSLDETFPDAKFVCMVRTPFETVPSTISMASRYFNTFLSPLDPHPFLEGLLDVLSQYYRYPLEKLDTLLPDRQQIISYSNLVERPAQTVSDLYARFGFAMNPAYSQILQKEQGKAQRYKSKHSYSLDKFVLTREQIVKRYEDIFNRFEFEKVNNPSSQS
jgi:hypothetical protein